MLIDSKHYINNIKFELWKILKSMDQKEMI